MGSQPSVLAVALLAGAIGCRADRVAPTPRPPAPRASAGNSSGSRGERPGLLSRWSRAPAVGPPAAPRHGSAGADPYDGYEIPSAPSRPPPAPYGRGYAPDREPLARAGSIVGTVRWLAAAEAEAHGCAPPHGLAPRGGAPVPGAVVYLERVRRGRAHLGRIAFTTSRLQIGGAVEIEPCGLMPRTQLVAPVGAVVSIGNRSPNAASLALGWFEPSGRPVRPPSADVVVDVAPGALFETVVERAGWQRVRRAGDPSTEAWLVAQPHPYFAMTDGDGAFRIDGVPPGTYDVVAWFPPRLVRREPTGTPRSTAASLRRMRVAVRAGSIARPTIRIAAAD